MARLKFLALLLMVICQAAFGEEEPIAINFSLLAQGHKEWQLNKELPKELLEADHKLISIKGFIYQNSDGAFVLAKEPNLKSCCVGSISKQGQQVYLIDPYPFEPTSLAVKLQGTLDIAKEGAPFYTLTKASIAESRGFSYLLIFTLALLAICAILYFKIAKN